MAQTANANEGLRTQYPYYGIDALSPRPLYDLPSPTSNYPSGMTGASPGFYPMAYQNTPRFASSPFLPPPDVFAESRKGASTDEGIDTPRELRARRLDALSHDPVGMHLLVETAIGDSQYFDVLSVEQVEVLKQEQRTLDGRLGPVRKKLESESKIRDAARSLSRLSTRNSIRHRRGTSKEENDALREQEENSEEELRSSEQKVEDLTRELLAIESRMRQIDVQLLMHTAAVLQLTHKGPAKQNRTFPLANGGVQRPDSPTSIVTYDTNDKRRSLRDDEFDERSLYRSPENLDSLMDALQNGTHHHTPPPERAEQPSIALQTTAKRVEELNSRLRELIVQADPERNREYSLPPRIVEGKADEPALDQQLNFLDQGIHDMGAELQNSKDTSKQSLNAIEGRLDGVNNQLYAMLARSDEKALPPPPMTDGGFQAQLDYMEDSFYNIQQLQYSMSEQLEDLRNQADSMSEQLDQMRAQSSTNKDKSNQDDQYEATLTGLWSIIQAGEEEARKRKRQRRELLSADPDASEEVSPDEDFDAAEPFSLNAFSAKVQMLYSRASTLKEKQSILVRQIKQQRELNSRSDAQKEEQFGMLKEQVLSARSEKVSMEKELERAMGMVKELDNQKNDAEERALRDAQERIEALETQLHHVQDDARVDAAAIKAELTHAEDKINEVTTALHAMTAEKEAAEARTLEANKALDAKEEELREMESQLARLITEVTLAKAELDGAYGTRAERAAESGAHIKTELEELTARNAALVAEIESLRKAHDAAYQSEAEAREVERNLKQELLGMTADYEALTRDSIQNEKDRDVLEAAIDKLRDEKESLEMELSDERVKWLGIRSPSVANGGPGTPMGGEATSIRMLREDFRKMMRERTAEGLRALRNEQEERRKLESLVRSMRKENAPRASNLSKQMTA